MPTSVVGAPFEHFATWADSSVSASGGVSRTPLTEFIDGRTTWRTYSEVRVDSEDQCREWAASRYGTMFISYGPGPGKEFLLPNSVAVGGDLCVETWLAKFVRHVANERSRERCCGACET